MKDMKHLANIFIGLGLFIGMIVMYVLGIVVMILLMLPVMMIFLIVLAIVVIGLEVFGVLFCLTWLVVGLVGLLTTGSTSWLKHLRIKGHINKIDKSCDALFDPVFWWMEHTAEPIAIEGLMEAGEYCRKRLIRNGDFTQ